MSRRSHTLTPTPTCQVGVSSAENQNANGVSTAVQASLPPLAEVTAFDFEVRVLGAVGANMPCCERTIARVLDRPVGIVHAALVRLRAAGLVDWTDGVTGTICPTVLVVGVGGGR